MRLACFAFVLVLALPTSPCAFGAEAVRDGMLLTLKFSPSAGDRFQQAVFSCWLPDTKKNLRGAIIHQHGCTSATPEKQPPVTLDSHWRALARKHDCALISPMYRVNGTCDDWNDPESGSERALLSALAHFASQSGHPELTNAPWLLWGHSGGSSWGAQMIVRHPQRILAASFRGGASKQFGAPDFRAKFAAATRDLPLLLVWGRREAVPASRHFVSWAPMNTMFAELRARGGKVGRLIDPESEHGCGNSRLVVIPFFDAVLGEPSAKAVFVECSSLERREDNSANRANPALAWLPSEALARLWREYSQHGTVRPAHSQLLAPSLAATRTDSGAIKLTWRVEPGLDGGVRGIRIKRDGMLWRELGPRAGSLLATFGDGPPDGLREPSCFDDSRKPHTYALTFTDVAGNESPFSQAVNVAAAR